jgi:2-amino-4-hydroxy-6-hydroxymethyldihydropteridine diphosphokinase
MPATAAAPVASSSRPRWVPACVALGSNLADPVQQVRRAMAALATLPHCQLVLQSSLYRTRPLGPVEQPDFVNAAAALLTQLDAVALLQALKSLELSLGRAAPVVRWGPRLIDLDLLVHGGTRQQDATLTVPHPGIAERAFVLLPLAEICPSLVVPGVGRVSTLLQRLDTRDCERLPA